MSGGRKAGQEDNFAHYRKGIAGDWRTYFTPRITRRFKELYGDLLMMGGYERNENW
ncbi:MAG: sulfotransferase domain-containing protein [Gammaproteobacteria bacterium]